MGPLKFVEKLKSLVSRDSSEDYFGDSPPQQIIMDPSANTIVQALNIRRGDSVPAVNSSECRPPGVSMGQVKPVGAAISVAKSSFSMEPIENGQFLIGFEYSASEETILSLLFQQNLKGLANGIPKFSKPMVTLPPVKLPLGSKLRYKMDVEEVKKIPELTMKSCSFIKETSFVPILLVFHCKSSEYTLFVMAGLARNDVSKSWDLIITKQRVKQGDSGYQIQEIYGINNSALNPDVRNASDENKDDDGNNRCVICLTNMKDTFILPCRHMCLCFICAKTMANQGQFCPICRCCISHIVSISNNGSA
ncbi:E3 ubiquitin-protein ligase mgrn1/rnf157 like protein [Babesia gibsoni]|uniref:E3 ubiquitin-protein ligase mgrn1/rnf157 like protein n=1 Tax=Babesia gibsoni TaxID=33632 RepID=A0AAD8LQ35_BABGI|nr:E3 ubiquitin-protein ligase mgrn1/rnf157 like protein [Babesia gibsoni]